MRRPVQTFTRAAAAALALGGAALGVGCTSHTDASAQTAPPPAVVVHEDDGSNVRLEHPERFPTVAATTDQTAPTLDATGVVTPDVSRTVPVLALVSGRVVDIRAQLGDRVTQGQLLLRIQSPDVSSALADYRKAQVDETLAKAQLARDTDLFGRGAIAKKDLEISQDNADKAAADLADAQTRLKTIGADGPQASAGLIEVTAPVSGVITEQNVTAAGGVRTLDNSPNLFTISDLSQVWIVCDVYENDLASVKEGDQAEVHVAAYPDKTLHGRISNIGPILDPTIRTAKVRVDVANPGILRVGMFVRASFKGQHTETHTVVPVTAILHLHDRAWVYVATSDGFRRQEVTTGPPVGHDQQELLSGLKPGDRVIANALVFQNTVGQ